MQDRIGKDGVRLGDVFEPALHSLPGLLPQLSLLVWVAPARVGVGLVIILSIIWVATTTGLAALIHFFMISF